MAQGDQEPITSFMVQCEPVVNIYMVDLSDILCNLLHTIP